MIFNVLVIILVVVCINRIIAVRKQEHDLKREKNEAARKQLQESFRNRYSEIEQFYSDIAEFNTRYVESKIIESLLHKYKDTYNYFISIIDKSLVDFPAYQVNNVKSFLKLYGQGEGPFLIWRQSFVESEIFRCNDLFSNIDGKSLDDQQRKAVVVDDDYNLVVAGAGCGKTLTIIAKVRYLVEVKQVRPEEILLLAFTRKAAEEMTERLKKAGISDIEAQTFHKLGKEIIAKAEQVSPSIADDSLLMKTVSKFFLHEAINNKLLLSQIIKYFTSYFEPGVNITDFASEGEYYQNIRQFDLTTLKGKLQKLTQNKHDTIKGERVKSKEEVIIANCLFMHGIEYQYEMEYEYPTGDRYHRSYRPDFYLPEYGIYIEHFGINKQGRLPQYTEIEEKKYIDGMKWKRKTHEDNGTKLLETYSYYNEGGQLEEHLKRIITAAGVKLGPVDENRIYKILISRANDRNMKDFQKLVVAFITLAKSKGFNEDNFDVLCSIKESDKNDYASNRERLFLNIAKHIFCMYQKELRDSKQIDFNDMILFSAKKINQSEINYPCKYIIIDEYQDISAARFKLVKAIRDQNNSKIFCVGDDWQSIFRFAGSDIKYFTDFHKQWCASAYTERLFIENTHRNSQELLDIAGSFIELNPNQLRKKLRSEKHDEMAVNVMIYGVGEDVLSDSEQFAFAMRTIHNFDSSANIMVLGRTKYDIEFIVNNNKLCRELKGNQDEIAKGKHLHIPEFPNLRVSFLTMHQAKGLEADYVIILNMSNDLLGMPNRITDDPIIASLLGDNETFPYAEERRLFYVALTRTRKRCFVMTPEYNESIFISEIKKDKRITWSQENSRNFIELNCPRCKTGRLLLRSGVNKKGSKTEFTACSNYPNCEYNGPNEILTDYSGQCPSCGGFLVKRKSKETEFCGCSNYPICRYTCKSNGEQATEKDRADAQFNLDNKDYNTEEKPADYSSGWHLRKKAAEQGYAEAQCDLGNMYYFRPDYEKAFYWYEKAAEQGLSLAQLSLGDMYREGKGTAVDYEKAFYWYEKAAEQELSTAQLSLGHMYREGEGTAVDYEKAFYWYEKAAEQEDYFGGAQYWLGYMYYKGKGTAVDYEKALYWYEKAAAQDHDEAQYRLAFMYKEGLGTAVDYEKALYWSCKAGRPAAWETKDSTNALFDFDDALPF